MDWFAPALGKNLGLFSMAFQGWSSLCIDILWQRRLQSFYWISDPLLLIHEGCKVILKPDLNKQLKIKGFFKILSTLSMCTVFTGHCSYIRCFVGAFDSLWKSPRFLEWTILLEWTNLCKTAFQDLRYFGCVYWDTYTSINGFDEWEICWIVAAGWGIWRFLKH